MFYPQGLLYYKFQHIYSRDALCIYKGRLCPVLWPYALLQLEISKIFYLHWTGGVVPTYGNHPMHAFFQNHKPMLIVRSAVLKAMRAYLLPPGADSKFLRRTLYMCTYEWFTRFTVYKNIPLVRICDVQFFSWNLIFLVSLFHEQFFPKILHFKNSWKVFFRHIISCAYEKLRVKTNFMWKNFIWKNFMWKKLHWNKNSCRKNFTWKNFTQEKLHVGKTSRRKNFK